MGLEKRDIVIPLGKGSNWEDGELRYCLRSIQRYMINYGNIFIIGECPQFIKYPVIHLPCRDQGDIISRNILEKIRIACNSSLVSEEFVLFNDDYFLTDNWDADNIPYFNSGTIQSSMGTNYNEDYNEYLYNTKDLLERNKKSSLNYDIHYPIVIDKNKFMTIMEFTYFYWRMGGKLLIRSIYCNYLNINSTSKVVDCKIRGYTKPEDFKDLIARGNIFSTGDQCIEINHYKNSYESDGALNIKTIKELYPDKSIYEI